MSTALPIGILSQRDDAEPALLRAEKFNRHTFWCGQSGSGKTYALGVLLEQLLVRTALPMLVLDPNADFVHVTELRDGVTGPEADAIRTADIRVLHSTAPGGQRLRTRFLDLDLRSKAAVLELDPLADPEEYNVLLRFEKGTPLGAEAMLLPTLAASSEPGRRELGRRIENLGVLEWELWARGAEAAEDVVRKRPRMTVMDLGGFDHHREARVAALAVLDQLLSDREQRRPLLIVIDEAHNLCSPEPQNPLDRALTDRIVQIAAEGRKYGLWLLLSTQRPSKIHPNVLSQCDNLVLMKMRSPRDLAELSEVFGYADPELLARCPGFAMGEALVAGGFVPEPSLVRMGSRLTREGGVDVPVPLLPDTQPRPTPR